MTEHSVVFGDGAALIGTLCLPHADAHSSVQPRVGIILFNAGIVHRIGPHRINVRLARTLAMRGIPSMRFDLAGLGDSARADGTAGFEEQAIRDLGCAMSTLGEATGLQKFGLFGFCSGAFHSFNTALVDTRVAGIMLFDAYRYGTPTSTIVRLRLRLRQHGIVGSTRRLLAKAIDRLRDIFRVTEQGGHPARASDPGFIADAMSKASFAAGLRRLLDRGTTVSMTFAGDGLEVYNYENQFRDAMKGLGIGHRVPTTFFPDMDHVATGIDAQKVLIDHLVSCCSKLAGIGMLVPVVCDIQRLKLPPVRRPREKHDTVQVAVILSRTITGLETVRCLAKAGITVHAIYFEKNDPVRLSRLCTARYFDAGSKDESALLDFLSDYCRQLGPYVVAVPTCDAHALMLAANRVRLSPVCRVMTAETADLNNVIFKNNLLVQADKAGLDLVPSLVAPTLGEAVIWSQNNTGPYLIKPYYAGVPSARLRQKNLVIASRDALLAFVNEGEMASLIVQRIIRGGDGFIFDCYGYCDASGRVVTMVSKRRLHQNVPDYGTCSMGQIPAHLDPDTEQRIFAHTRRFFQSTHYHGIFGIEWLCDQQSRQLYLIDFNARPFMSIGHVMAAGVNLPAMAFAELAGKDLSDVDPTPRLKPLIGVDVLRDVESLQAKRLQGRLHIAQWMRLIIRCRYFYYTDWRDPLPGLARAFEIVRRALAYHINRRVRTGSPLK